MKKMNFDSKNLSSIHYEVDPIEDNKTPIGLKKSYDLHSTKSNDTNSLVSFLNSFSKIKKFKPKTLDDVLLNLGCSNEFITHPIIQSIFKKIFHDYQRVKNIEQYDIATLSSFSTLLYGCFRFNEHSIRFQSIEHFFEFNLVDSQLIYTKQSMINSTDNSTILETLKVYYDKTGKILDKNTEYSSYCIDKLHPNTENQEELDR